MKIKSEIQMKLDELKKDMARLNENINSRKVRIADMDWPMNQKTIRALIGNEESDRAYRRVVGLEIKALEWVLS